MKVKRVAILAYYYPPYADVSGVRASKYVKFLPQYSWEPIVITVDPRYYKGKVVKSDTGKALDFGKIIKNKYYNFPFNVLICKLLFPFYSFIQVLNRKSDIDIVYITGSPYHPFILSFFFKFFLNIKTVLDFRDSWSINHGFDGKARRGVLSFIREKLYILIERFSIKYACYVVFATKELMSEYANVHYKYKNKFSVIHNGVDYDDFKEVKPNRINQKNIIIISGKFLLYTPDAFSLMAEVLKNNNDLFFFYIGGEYKQIEKCSLKYDVSSQVKALPYQDYKLVLDYIAGSDVCLFTNGMKNGLGTKIFDYVALKKPVVCLVPKGSVVFECFSEKDYVFVLEYPCDFDVFESYVNKAMSAIITDYSENVKKYSRCEASKKLSDIFNECVGKI